jgi:hypothetical protein
MDYKVSAARETLRPIVVKASPGARGWFHGWGTTSLQDYGVLVQVSVAIVELEDGTVATYAPHEIRFTD